MNLTDLKLVKGQTLDVTLIDDEQVEPTFRGKTVRCAFREIHHHIERDKPVRLRLDAQAVGPLDFTLHSKTGSIRRRINNAYLGFHDHLIERIEVVDSEDRARARHGDPPESHAAAASVGRTTPSQRAVLTVMRSFADGRSFTDEELVRQYLSRYKALHLPRQSESGLRSRRAELSRAGRLLQGDPGVTDSGRRCRSWRIA